MSNLAMNLLKAAQASPNRPAVRWEEDTLTFEELDRLAGVGAAYLADRGVLPGDRVGIMSPNLPIFPILYYAVLRRGAIVVPMNPLLKAREVAHYVEDSGMRLLIAHASIDQAATGSLGAEVNVLRLDDVTLRREVGRYGVVAPMARVTGDDTAVILYTSGTTGAPKGAELTHANLDHNCRATGALAALGPEDVVMGCLPLFHAFGQSAGMNAAVAAGALLTLVPRFDPATVLHVLERDAVTIFQGVPTMYGALIAHGTEGRDVASLRQCVSGGASLPAEVMRRFRDLFGTDILEGYGLSETSPTVTFNRADAAKIGSIGKPIEGVEVKLVDASAQPVAAGEVGEILVRGHNVMKGYWRRPEATAEAMIDGWFRTGDLARMDDDGFLFVVDRKKELIIRGGFNVYPREVEEVLYEHPAVAEAAVIGVPHQLHGEEIVAAVALRAGASATEDEVRDFAKERVAPYKYPRRVLILDALPKGSTGKIMKREIDVPVDILT